MPSEYAKALGTRLRSIRQQQGLSLHGVEQKSKGRWKAVVVGSYERGDRAVTVQRLAELAAFYGVPVAELLPGGSPGGAVEPPPKLVIDLEALQHAPTDNVEPAFREQLNGAGVNPVLLFENPSGQRFFGIVCKHRHGRLDDDWTLIALIVDKMHRATGESNAMFKRLFLDPKPGERRQ